LILDFPHHHYTRFKRRRGAMDPATQLALDALFDRFTTEVRRQIGDLDTKLERRFCKVEDQQSARVQALENSLTAATTEFETLLVVRHLRH